MDLPMIFLDEKLPIVEIDNNKLESVYRLGLWQVGCSVMILVTTLDQNILLVFQIIHTILFLVECKYANNQVFTMATWVAIVNLIFSYLVSFSVVK